MASHKIVVLVFLASFCYCSASDPHAPLAGDLYSEAMRLYGELQAAIGVEVHHALAELTDALEKMSSLSKTVYRRAEVRAESERKSIEEEMIDIKREAAEKQVDHTYCTAGREDIVLSIPDTVLQDIDNCIGPLVASGASASSGGIASALNIENSINSLESGIINCDMDDQCLLTFINILAVAVVDTPIRIRENTDVTVDVIKALDKTIEKCAYDREASIELIANIIIAQIRNCISSL